MRATARSETRRSTPSKLLAQRREFVISKQTRILKASYHAVLALGDQPSVRTVGAMFKRITGKGIRLDTVRAWLSRPDTVRIRSEYERDTPTVLKNGVSDTPGIQLGYLRARDQLSNGNYKRALNGKLRDYEPAPDLPAEERSANLKRLSKLCGEIVGP